MKYQVNAITPLKAAKVLAAVAFLVTLPILLVSLVTYNVAWPQGPAYILWVFLIVPLVNAIFGFFVGLVLAFCYNVAAKRMGGFELTLQEKQG